MEVVDVSEQVAIQKDLKSVSARAFDRCGDAQYTGGLCPECVQWVMTETAARMVSFLEGGPVPAPICGCGNMAVVEHVQQGKLCMSCWINKVEHPHECAPPAPEPESEPTSRSHAN